MSRTLSRLMMIVAFSSVPSLQMIAMEPETSQNPLSAISGASLTALYQMSPELRFYIPRIKGTENIDTFKKILNSDGFRTVKGFVMLPDWSDPEYAGKDWSDGNWQANHYRLIHGISAQEAENIKHAKEKIAARNIDDITPEEWDDLSKSKLASYERNKRSLDELSVLLKDAKSVLKSFIPLRNWNPDHFVQKSPRLNRLFTYAKLERIIKEKNLTHIRLPIKFLCFKDVQSGEYVIGQEALNILDNALKICLHPDFSFSILFVSDKYRMEIFASKEKKEGNGLSKMAMDELFTLCKEAPFDIGYDNIFWDIKGDAIIIDTEYKGESVHDCQKLNRYPIDSNL